MWSLIFALTWSAVTASPLFQEATPESNLQKMTTELPQPISDNLIVDQYLRTYGYMNDVDELSQDYAQRRTDALKSFQRFAGVKVTGEVDEDTWQQMLRPRCGMKDIQIERPSNVAKWNVTEITYRFRSFTDDISECSIRSAFVDGLSPWEVPANLKFENIESGTPIMEIEFVKGKHPPCGVKMDGPGGVIAHAYYPSRSPLGGDMHFDGEETYKYKEGTGYDLVSLVLHEAGHALGLSHDNMKGSIMLPWYTGQTTLGPNDIKRIKQLYA